MGLNQALNTMVVLCAGGGTRFMNGKTGKLHALVSGKPLLRHAIEPWIRPGRKWIFVLSPTDSETAPLLDSMGVNAHFEYQPTPIGITDAILRAAPAAGSSFTVLLGDCLMRGRFELDVPYDCGIGVWAAGGANDVKNNYGVEIRDALIRGAVEKPGAPSGLLCGMGVYFFNSELADFCGTSFLESGGGAHITSILNQWTAREGKPLSPVWFEGDYVNVNTIEALPRAEAIVDCRDQNDHSY